MYKYSRPKYFKFLDELVKSDTVVTMGQTDKALIKQFVDLEIPGNDPSFYARRVIQDWAHYNMTSYITGDTTIWFDEDGERHWQNTEELKAQEKEDGSL